MPDNAPTHGDAHRADPVGRREELPLGARSWNRRRTAGSARWLLAVLVLIALLAWLASAGR